MEKATKHINLRSEEVQEILTKVPNWMIRWGSALFFSLILLLLLISWIIKYPDLIVADAKITTEIPPQKEFARSTAKIDSIYIKESQVVKKNTILAVLENTAITEHVHLLKAILDTIKITSKDIEFPIDSLPILFLGDVDQSYSTFENSYLQYKLNQRLKPFLNEAIANKISLSELNRRIASLQVQYSMRESELRFKMNDLDRNKVLFQKGVISEKEFEDKQLEVLSAERDFKNMKISISQIREAIGGAKKNSKETEISKTREERQLLKTVIQSFNDLRRTIEEWENKYVLKSEINGRVSFLNYWSENQSVMIGDLVFTILPTIKGDYIAKLKAPSQNSGKIVKGQSVNIKLQNYPDTEFGVLKGTVKSISLVPDIEGYYLVDVLLPDELLTSYNKKIKFKQEMNATAEIVTEDLRLLERFFYRLLKITNP